MESSVCLFCTLAGSSVSESLLSFQAVETEVPANEASFIQGMCDVSWPGDLCSTSAKTFHLRLIHFILFLASLVLMQTTFYSVYKSY